MIVGTGVDLVKVQRIKSAVDRWGDRFVGKILTADEVARYHNHKSGRIGYLARQFAAKEAVSKALGTGMGAGIHFSQIEVGRLASGKPFVELSGHADEHGVKLGIDSWHVSISDEKEFSVAFVVAEKSSNKTE